MNDRIILKTDNLGVGYNGKKIIDSVDISIKPGVITTIIGPNGCGKSTILKTLTRQLDNISGCIFIDGKDSSLLKDRDIAKKLSMVMTNKVSPELMTCLDIVASGRYPYTGMFGRLSEDDKKIIEDAIELFNLSDIASSDFSKISDGQRQRVMLARSVCQEPSVLILDEPTTFLDIKYKMDILGSIRRLAKKKNVAVVMSLHELEFALKISDEIIAIDTNRSLVKGTPSEIISADVIKKLYSIADDDFNYFEDILTYLNKKGEHNINYVNRTTQTLEHKSSSTFDKLCKPINDINKHAKVIMVQGTMSGAGKSLIVAGLCRIFANDGYKVMPFKSQNMALNSYVTEDGLEMGRAQVMQAECAKVKPSVYMNPILLKPTDDCGSQVIVNGKVLKNMRAREYFDYKTSLIPDIINAYNELSREADIIVVEGAGSPAEINLKNNDIVNMGLAAMLDAPVLLVGDIDRGGVFAQLLGTLNLLTSDELSRVKGLIVNKFRGDKSILDSGITMLEERGGKAVVGITPYMDINLEDEDSLTERFNNGKQGAIDIVVIRYPHISNFTDFNVFDQIPDANIRYVNNVAALGNPDMVILPGSKNTISDIKWLYETKLHEEIISFANDDCIIFGICGGYQMLGLTISDPDNTECGGSIEGLGLLPVNTVLKAEKSQSQYMGKITNATGAFSGLKDSAIEGYEIHMGETILTKACNDKVVEFTDNKTGYCQNNIYGSYVHGIFDKADIVTEIIEALAKKKGIDIAGSKVVDFKDYKESQYEKMAEILREHLDMDAIYEILNARDDG